MRLLLAALWLLVAATPVAAQSRVGAPVLVFAGLVPVHTTLGVLDARRTVRCVEQLAGCIEVNPIFNAIAVNRDIRHSMRVKVAADQAMTAAFGYALHRWPQRRWAIVGAYAANIAVKGLVLRHNRRVTEALAPVP